MNNDCFSCKYGVPNYTVDGPILQCGKDHPWIGKTETEAMRGCKEWRDE